MNSGPTNIEGLKNSANALGGREGPWWDVFEHHPAMCFMADATGVILSANAAVGSQLGYAVDELIGQSALDLVVEEDREMVRKKIAACLDTPGQSSSWEVRKARKDGTVLWIRENAKAMRWQGNQSVALIAGEDITERYLDELQSSRLAAIVSTSDDAIVSKTLEGKVTSWNTAATKIFGYDASEMVGQPIFRIIPPELHDEEKQILMRLQRGERIQHYETTRIAKDGHRVEVSLTVSPLFNNSGMVVGASKVARDITAAKRAQAELHQAQTQLAQVARVTTVGELTAAIAHEVNQPLTGLVSSGNACLRWLAAEPPNVEAARQSVQRMVSAGNRAGEVISRIRALVGKSPPQRDRININDVIVEVISLIDGEIRRNRISLQTKLSSDVPVVLGDRIQLQQVILNLMLNAVEAMSEVSQERRELWVSSVKDADGALVTVRDSGVGLDTAAIDRLFEAFYTTKPHGMGIGLAVSRTIIRAHGGRLWATLNEPQGAVFQFTLPVGGGEVS